MRLKKFLLTLVAIVATAATVSTTSAQDLSGWSAGGKISIYSGWNGTVGVGVFARHDIGDMFRIEPSFLFLCEKGMSIEVAADLQYPIDLSENFEVYPLAGLTLNDPGKFGLGINIGGGLGYKISNRLTTDLGLKWIIQTQKYISNPIAISLGCGYKF